jgi:TrmH family RNA methyltransferase
MRDNRSRRKAQRVIVDGWRESQRASEAGLELIAAYVLEEDVDRAGNIFGSAIQPVSASVMQKISFGQSPRGLVTEFIQPVRTLDALVLPPSPLLLVLDGIEKPGNIGAVFRCADGAGIDAVVLSDCRCDLFNPNAIRSSLGAVFSTPAAIDSAENVQAFLDSHSIRVIAARVESSSDLWQTDLMPPLAIVLGSEADGLAARWQAIGENPIPGVRIPMNGQVDSLNISVSAAVLSFEAARQRR